MSALDALFRDEVERQAYTLRECFERCAQHPPDGEMLFAAQALKGAARVVGIPEAERIADTLEAMLSTAEASGTVLIPEQLQACTDALELIEAIAQVGARRARDVAREAQIQDVTVRLTAHLTPSEPSRTSRPLESLPSGTWDLFRQECELHTSSLIPTLLSLEQQPDQPELVERVMRSTHSLKGAARAVGLDATVMLACAAEDQLERVRRAEILISPDLVDALLSACDLFQRIGVTVVSGTGVPSDASILDCADRIQQAGLQSSYQRAGQPAANPSLRDTVPDPTAPESPDPGKSDAGSRAAAWLPQPTAATSQESRDGQRTVRIRADQLSQIVAQAGALVVEAGQHRSLIAQQQRIRGRLLSIADLLDDLQQGIARDLPNGRLHHRVEEIKQQLNDLRVANISWADQHELNLRRTEDLSLRLYGEALDSRMRPVADGLAAFPRLVRDVARRLGKQASLQVRGESHRIDREILERIEAPLNHLLRNAVDHGVEKPIVRRQRGKPELGCIEIEIRVTSSSMDITVSDDGSGVDLARVRERITALELMGREAVEGFSQEQLLDQLFVSGFSTADQITELSGRGVGLAVVRSVMRDIGGSVRVTTQAGLGAQFHLRLPISRSVLRAVVVVIAGEAYALSLARIDQVLRLPCRQADLPGDRHAIVVEGRTISLVRAADVLGLDSSRSRAELVHGVVVSSLGHHIAFLVDDVCGEQDMVLQPIDPRLGRIPNLSAAAILADGRPVLILDAEELVRSTLSRQVAPGESDHGSTRPPQSQRQRILVVDDSPTVRAMEQELLAQAGYDVTVAGDGMEAWTVLREQDFDLVVADVDMPRLDGIGLIRSIRQDARLARMPVIILSYRTSREERQRGLDAGANVYLTKDVYEADSLLETVHQLLQRSQPGGQPARAGWPLAHGTGESDDNRRKTGQADDLT